jgi:hypothetical protein
MPWGDRLRAAEPYIIGIAVPLTVVLLGIVVPIQFVQQSAIAALTVKFDEGDKRMDLRFAGLDRTIDYKTDAVIKKIDEFGKKIDLEEHEIKSFEDRVAAMETDPKKLLERLGVATDTTLTAVSVRNELYVLPRTIESAQIMVDQGYEKRQIAPMVAGFLVQPSRATGPTSTPISPFTTVPLPAQRR